MKRIPIICTIVSASVIAPMYLYAGWIKTYDYGPGCAVQQTPDDGYIVFAMDGLIKTDAGGDTLWTRRYSYGSTARGEVLISTYSGQQTSDGGYILAGTIYYYEDTEYDVCLLKTDSLGDTIWMRTYGNENWEEAYCVEQTEDGGYILTGYRSEEISEVQYDYYLWLLKTDSQGDTLWTRSYGGNDEAGYCVQETSDGGYIVTGVYEFSALWLLKTDSYGDTLWTSVYGEIDGAGLCVRETTDNGYIIAGWMLPPSGEWMNLWLLRTDSQGDTLWTKEYGESRYSGRGYHVEQTNDDGYVVTGIIGDNSNFDLSLWLLKTDSQGDTLWTQKYGDETEDETGYCVRSTSDGGYIITGQPTEDGGTWLVKTDANGDTTTTSIFDQPPVEALTFELLTSVGSQVVLRFADANRSQGDCVAVFDISGSKVDELPIPQTDGVVSWGEEHSPGVYFIVADINGNHRSEKVILVR